MPRHLPPIADYANQPLRRSDVGARGPEEYEHDVSARFLDISRATYWTLKSLVSSVRHLSLRLCQSALTVSGTARSATEKAHPGLRVGILLSLRPAPSSSH